MKYYSVTARNASSWSTIADGFVPMDHDYHNPEHWTATLTVQETADHRLLRWDQRGVRTSSRTRPLIRRVAADEFYWVVFPDRGSYSVRYRDEDTRVVPGQGAVTLVDQVCSIHIPQSTAYALQLPRNEIDCRAGAFGTLAASLDLGSGLGRITRSLIRSTHAEQAVLSVREFDAVCARIAELLCLLWLGDTSPQQGHHTEVTEQVRRYVRYYAGHRDMRLPAVAAALGWSPRQVRAMLQRSGTTYRDVRREETLRAAQVLLGDPALAGVPIGELAARSGFTSTWFSTAFKDHFGETPREFRQRRAGELARGEGRADE
ncbi:AraC family transcriptional regulator [Nocardia blacklockiae]|uniref:AraC family transcriptional regulator n=1 Tax=Nocardia blacklockiae TaxID=480036 RepID=UPI001894D8DD|nr:AraC family transcriptional regulator [Nocardia blacklockiae]MBF6175762.1 AraC family transcriptional regulator [Nocardia blacklockiae]